MVSVVFVTPLGNVKEFSKITGIDTKPKQFVVCGKKDFSRYSHVIGKEVKKVIMTKARAPGGTFEALQRVGDIKINLGLKTGLQEGSRVRQLVRFETLAALC